MTPFLLHDLETAPPPSRAILAALRDDRGQLPNLIRTLAESPVALDAYRQLTALLAGSSLSPLEQQVVYIAAAHANHCHYCSAPNPMLGDDAQALEVASAIRRGQRLDDVRLQALRRFTALVSEHRGWVAEDQVESFLRAGFTRENLLEVITGIALVTLSSYANHIAATPVDHLASEGSAPAALSA